MENIDEEITHNTLQEIDYPQVMIKRVTPYLNDITYIQYKGLPKEKEVKVSRKHRAYAWYYVHNGGIQSDAYRRAYYCKYHSIKRKLIPHKDIKASTIATGGVRTYRMEHVQRCISLIREQLEQKIRVDVPQTMLQQLQIQSTYDPMMFINPDGSPAFTSWDEIPLEYRCCIEGIEPTKYGIRVKLVDRDKSREKLLGLAPGLLAPQKKELTLLTKDDKGKEIGLDTINMSDAALRAIIASTEGK